jgi:large subunit ribosomal protein L10
MTRQDKAQAIQSLVERLENASYFYITDAGGLNVDSVNQLRRLCFQRGVDYTVVKNTMLRKALEQIDSERYQGLFDALHGETSIMVSDVGNVPAKLIKDFRAKKDKPLVKAAYIDQAIYLGDESLDALAALKSKNELIGEIVGLLQSPAKNVLGALQSGGNKLAGIVKALEERG